MFSVLLAFLQQLQPRRRRCRRRNEEKKTKSEKLHISWSRARAWNIRVRGDDSCRLSNWIQIHRDFDYSWISVVWRRFVSEYAIEIQSSGISGVHTWCAYQNNNQHQPIQPASEQHLACDLMREASARFVLLFDWHGGQRECVSELRMGQLALTVSARIKFDVIWNVNFWKFCCVLGVFHMAATVIRHELHHVPCKPNVCDDFRAFARCELRLWLRLRSQLLCYELRTTRWFTCII